MSPHLRFSTKQKCATTLMKSSFDLVVELVDDMTGNFVSGNDYNLGVRICLESSDESLPSSMFSYDKVHSYISKDTGICTLSLKINEVSKNVGNKKFVISVSTNVNGRILSAQSAPITCYTYKLQIINSIPDTWYKDDIGRDKGIEVNIRIAHSPDIVVSASRKVVIKPTLLYGNGTEVSKQEDLLLVAPDTRLTFLLKGEAFVRFRITEVSKNHQRQSFRLLLSPLSEEDCDIAPVMTSSIVVKSKKNVLREKRKADDIDSPPQNLNDIPMKLSKAEPLLLPPSVSRGRLITSQDHLKDVAQWTERVVRALHGLKWQHIGYDVASGSGRPVYNMSNPNSIADSLLAEYSTSVKRSLDLVQKSVSNAVNENRARVPRYDTYSDSSSNSTRFHHPEMHYVESVDRDDSNFAARHNNIPLEVEFHHTSDTHGEMVSGISKDYVCREMETHQTSGITRGFSKDNLLCDELNLNDIGDWVVDWTI